MQKVVGIWATGSYSRWHNDAAKVDPLQTQLNMERRTKGELLTRSGGEYREEETNWIVTLCDKIHEALGLPFFRRNKRPTYLRYNIQVMISFLFRPRARRRIKQRALPELQYARWAREDRKIFNKVQEREGGKALYMRGLPSPRAVKIFSGLLFGFLRVFEGLMKPQARQILEADPEAVIQWELPVELSFGSLRLYPKWLKRLIFKRFMRLFERLVAATPADSRHAFHLCWGDLNSKPYVPVWLRSDSARVLLINAILDMKVWRHNGGEHVLYAIHDPFCDGRHAPSEDPAKRAIYKLMKPFPEETTYVVGILQRDFTVSQIVSFMRGLMNELSGRVLRFALAAPCGDQRKEDAEVAQQYLKASEALRQLRQAA